MMGEANDSANAGGAGASIDQNNFTDLFPSNWGDFELDSLSFDSFLSDNTNQQQRSFGSDLSLNSTNSSKSLSPPTKEHIQHEVMLNGQKAMGAGQDFVTKPRTGPGRHPRQRSKPQNLFNVWSQPQAPPQMMPMSYAGPTSPYLGGDFAAAAAMMQGGSPLMGMADPYGWMQAGRAKRPAFYGPPTSPSLLYSPYGNQMASPPFGYHGAQPGFFPPMYTVPSMKLPVQALHRPVEHNQPSENTAPPPFMAPLVLPADLGKKTNDVDPAAIPSAITSFLGGNTESSGMDENMRLYEMTFKAFVKEEAQIDYSNVTVVELKRLLRKYQLAATGKKEELIKMVKDVSEFLKKLPLKDGESSEDGEQSGGEKKRKQENVDGDSEKEEKEGVSSKDGLSSKEGASESKMGANAASANSQESALDRFLV